MSTLSVATLVIVTAKGCRACATYKATTEQGLLSALGVYSEGRKKRGLGGIDVISVSLESTGSNSTKKLGEYHPDLQSQVGWFPTFMLFNGKSWRNKSGKLNGVIYNAVYNGTKWEPVMRSPTTQASIMAWVKESIFKNQIFSDQVNSSLRSPSNLSNQRLTPILQNPSAGGLRILPGSPMEMSSIQPRIKYGSAISEDYTGDRSW